jgi:hypothetical protein
MRGGGRGRQREEGEERRGEEKRGEERRGEERSGGERRGENFRQQSLPVLTASCGYWPVPLK